MPLTINDIRAMSKPTILASEAAQVLRMSANSIRVMARLNPSALGFPVICSTEHNVEIPRNRFYDIWGRRWKIEKRTGNRRSDRRSAGTAVGRAAVPQDNAARDQAAVPVDRRGGGCAGRAGLRGGND